jgi:hypothetical protein
VGSVALSESIVYLDWQFRYALIQNADSLERIYNTRQVMQTDCTDVSEHVTRTLGVLQELPHGPSHQRPLSLSNDGVNPAENSGSPDHYLRILLTNIANEVGAGFLSSVNPALLEQFCIMTVLRGEPGGKMLNDLLSSFLSSYADPKSSDSAVDLLGDLIGLSGTAHTPSPAI